MSQKAIWFHIDKDAPTRGDYVPPYDISATEI